MCVWGSSFSIGRTTALNSAKVTAQWLRNDSFRRQICNHVTLWSQNSTLGCHLCLTRSKPTFIPHSEIFGTCKGLVLWGRNRGLPPEGANLASSSFKLYLERKASLSSEGGAEMNSFLKSSDFPRSPGSELRVSLQNNIFSLALSTMFCTWGGTRPMFVEWMWMEIHFLWQIHQGSLPAMRGL